MRSERKILLLFVFLILLAGCRSARSTLPDLIPVISPIPPTMDSTTAEPEALPTETEVLATAEPEKPLTTPTLTSTSTPTQTPVPRLSRLTTGGCCVEPFWSPDGRQVLYIDRPSPDLPSGIWAVDLQGTAPTFFTDRLGIFSPDMQLRAFPRDGETIIERVETEEQWQIPNGGRPISFSPDGVLVAWTAGDFGPPFDSAEREVWVSQVDGSQPRQVFSATRGGFAGWFPDGRLLVSGLVTDSNREQAYWALTLGEHGDDQPDLVELGRGGRLREAKISTAGSWLAYLVTFSQDPAQDGLWVADTHSGERWRLDVFGGYNWRDDGHLLVVPLDLSQPTHRLLQVQVGNQLVEPVTDPLITPFRIANGDWRVSPQGDNMVFLSADDGNIWVLTLP